jgi:hypothetical protein
MKTGSLVKIRDDRFPSVHAWRSLSSKELEEYKTSLTLFYKKEPDHPMIVRELNAFSKVRDYFITPGKFYVVIEWKIAQHEAIFDSKDMASFFDPDTGFFFFSRNFQFEEVK